MLRKMAGNGIQVTCEFPARGLGSPFREVFPKGIAGYAQYAGDFPPGIAFPGQSQGCRHVHVRPPDPPDGFGLKYTAA
jgi:hypothetical protein